MIQYEKELRMGGEKREEQEMNVGEIETPSDEQELTMGEKRRPECKGR